MRKTIKQLNQDAAYHIAANWLEGAEHILSLGNGWTPTKLSELTRENMVTQVKEWFWEKAEKENKRWYISDRNWESIRANAVWEAKQIIRFRPEEFPKTIAHFSNKPEEVK